MQLIYEDNHILAVSKTCHEIVQADRTGDEPLPETLKRFIKERDHKPGNVFLGVTHRLDRPTTGIVLFAKTSKALERLNRMFATGEVHKTYWCIVAPLMPRTPGVTEEGWKKMPVLEQFAAAGIPLEQDLTHYLVRNEQQNRSYAYDTREEAARRNPKPQEARLHYQVLSTTERYALLEVQLYTGRHHQIRCQLSHIGLVIKGDLKYGAPRSNPDGGIALHSRRAVFVHPVSKQEVTLVAPIPDDALWHALADSLESKIDPE